MAGSRMKKKAAEAKARLAKKAAMHEAGGKSKYAKRKAARQRGEPMAARKVAPWWSVLAAVMRPIATRYEPEFDQPTRSAA